MNRKPDDDSARELAALAAMPDAAIDTTDLPETVGWSDAERGRFYRPIKRPITIRLDADIIAWFRCRDAKYQSAINRVLREHMLRHG